MLCLCGFELYSLWVPLILLKLHKVGRIFKVSSHYISLPSVTTDDRKQFQCLHIVLNNTIWNPVGAKKVLAFKKINSVLTRDIHPVLAYKRCH